MSTSKNVSTVAIAGMSGKLGTLVATRLLKHHPSVTIHGLVRSPSKVDESITSSPNVKLFQTDSGNVAALTEALRGVDVAICTYLGDNKLMEQGQYALIDACIAAGVPRYFASDYSFDYNNLAYGDHPSKDPMKHVAAYLEAPERRDKISGAHVLIGAFMEVVWGYLGLFNDGEFRYWGTGKEKWEVTTYADAAAFIAEATMNPERSGNLSFLGDTINTFEMADKFEEVHKWKPKLTNVGTVDELKRNLDEKLKTQLDNPYAWMADAYTYWIVAGRVDVPKPLLNDQYPQIKVTTTKEYLEKTPVKNLGPPRG